MSRRAIVIGVDGYAFKPLTTAVNDAVAVRDTLLGRGMSLPPIFAEDEIDLLVAPRAGRAAVPDALPATRDAIIKALLPHYEAPDPLSFLLVYFAGHGLSVAGPDERTRETVMLPADVEGIEAGRNMLSLTQLLGAFSERGPLQQLWIIDACRDMRYTRAPRGISLEWPAADRQLPRAQCVIHAVAQGGEALANPGEQGRFTQHLIAGLKGEGCAADYVPGSGHCVTAQSLFDYVRRRIGEALIRFDAYTQTVQAPLMTQTGGRLRPLRSLPAPARRPFEARISPAAAVQAVNVALEWEAGVPVSDWPPDAPPRVYELRATLRPGMAADWHDPVPPSTVVDLREVRHAEIEVRRRDRVTLESVEGSPAPPLSNTTEGVTQAEVKSTPSTDMVFRSALPAAPFATLTVEATDPVARVRLRQQQWPWDQFDAPRNQPVPVPPGVWEIAIAIGDETFSTTRVVLSENEHRIVTAVAPITSVTAALLTTALESGVTKALDQLGTLAVPMQGAILPTLLPLIALKAYDDNGALRNQLDGLDIPTVPRQARADANVALVIAAEGNQWIEHPVARPLTRLKWQGAQSRVSLYTGGFMSTPEFVSVEFAHDRLELAVPTTPEGLTVVGVTAWPDGRRDVTIGIYKMPVGSAWNQTWRNFTVAALARASALAAPLFRADAFLPSLSDDVLSEIAMGKWLDPVLGALAFHAHDRAYAARLARAQHGTPPPPWEMQEIRENMSRHFPWLPDSCIIAACHLDPDERRRALIALLDDPALRQPVLTASLAHLARAALVADRTDHWALDRYERIAPGQVFNVVRSS